MRQTVGDRIRIVRESYNLSQTKFGRKIGVSKKTVSNYERGETEVPQDIVRTICKKFKTTYDYIYDGKEEDDPENFYLIEEKSSRSIIDGSRKTKVDIDDQYKIRKLKWMPKSSWLVSLGIVTGAIYFLPSEAFFDIPFFRFLLITIGWILIMNFIKIEEISFS